MCVVTPYSWQVPFASFCVATGCHDGFVRIRTAPCVWTLSELIERCVGGLRVVSLYFLTGSIPSVPLVLEIAQAFFGGLVTNGAEVRIVNVACNLRTVSS